MSRRTSSHVSVDDAQQRSSAAEEITSETESVRESGTETVWESDDSPEVSAADVQRRLREVQAELSEARRELESAAAKVEASLRSRAIDRALAAAGAVDLETASMLVESALSAGEAKDAGAAVTLVRRRKPFLFAGGGAGAMARHVDAAASLEDAAVAAKRVGDRRSLLAYLRLRRAAVAS